MNSNCPNDAKKILIDVISNETSSDETDSSEDAEEFLCILQESSDSSDTTTESLEPRRKLHRIESYLSVIDSYDETEFKEHFRLKRCTCDYLIQKIEAEGMFPCHRSGREKVSVKQAVYMTIWYLANTETFRQISDRFNITRSTAHRIISKIVKYLVDHSQEYIVWPDEERKIIVKRKFEEKQGISGAIGAIDGSHIPIRKPNSQYAHVYYNRKGYCSILLQGVCDHNKKFTDVFCGEAGSIHDARLLKKSSLYEKGLNNMLGNDFLLGDSAYPCLNWLIPPFKDNGHLSEQEKIFNYRHSSTRIIIENAFGLLKGRFRRLTYFQNESIIFIVKCVVAATVLHNICIDFDDEIEAVNDDIHEDYDEEYVRNVSGIQSNQTRRSDLFYKMFHN